MLPTMLGIRWGKLSGETHVHPTSCLRLTLVVHARCSSTAETKQAWKWSRDYTSHPEAIGAVRYSLPVRELSIQPLGWTQQPGQMAHMEPYPEPFPPSVRVFRF